MKKYEKEEDGIFIDGEKIKGKQIKKKFK